MLVTWDIRNPHFFQKKIETFSFFSSHIIVVFADFLLL